MARHFLISISGIVGVTPTTIWLTSDGTETGRRCRTQTPGIDLLREAESGNTTVAAGGSPFTEKPLNAGGGKAFEILIENCPTARFDALKAFIDTVGAQAGNDAIIDISFEGETGDVEVSCVPNWSPTPIGFPGNFSTGNVREVALRFITIPS